MRRVAASLLALSVLLSSLPWEVSVLSAGEVGAEASLFAGGPSSANGELPARGPLEDDCACLCPLCPVAATQAHERATVLRCAQAAPRSVPRAFAETPHSNDELSRLFRPPREG